MQSVVLATSTQAENVAKSAPFVIMAGALFLILARRENDPRLQVFAGIALAAGLVIAVVANLMR